MRGSERVSKRPPGGPLALENRSQHAPPRLPAPSQNLPRSAIFLSELRVLLPLIVLPLNTLASLSFPSRHCQPIPPESKGQTSENMVKRGVSDTPPPKFRGEMSPPKFRRRGLTGEFCLAFTEFQGERSVSSSHFICAKANSPSFSQNSVNLPQSSVTVFYPFPTKGKDSPPKKFVGGPQMLKFHAQYDWTTGVLDNGHEWRKFRVVPRSHPLRPLILYFFK